MAQVFVFVMCILVVLPIAILWVKGIDYMKDNHPDYKGEDFLNNDKKVSSEWEDEPAHYEGEF